ncbi:MAG: hypothetical protein RIR65_1461 [Planctomycetota bacterium]|jgi:hypothetical protein
MLSTFALLATLAVAGLVAWRLGGALAGGVVCGALAGTSLTGLSILRLRHVARHQPRQVFRALVEGFLAKLAVLLGGTLAFHGIDLLRQQVDPIAFLLTFASAALLILVPGTWESARILAASRPAGQPT